MEQLTLAPEEYVKIYTYTVKIKAIPVTGRGGL
jgi:hypothetical protein